MSRAGTEPGATSRENDNRAKRKPWWLWLLLGLLALAVLLIALSQCGTDDDPAPTAGAPTSSAAVPSALTPTAVAPTASTAAGADAGAGSSTLTAGGTALLPVAQAAGANGELTSRVGQPADARGAVVQSVPADEGFWVGTSPTDRVWVQLTGDAGESGYTVKPGDRVDFTGQVVAHDAGFAARTGAEPTDAEQLTRQSAHIEVAKPDLRGTSG